MIFSLYAILHKYMIDQKQFFHFSLIEILSKKIIFLSLFRGVAHILCDTIILSIFYIYHI